MKYIKCKISGLPMREITYFAEFQGNLKKLSQEAKTKLKQSILRNGFNAPIYIWKGNNFILDGHQRIVVLKELFNQGYVLETEDNKIPYISVEAKDKKEAAEMVLTYNSQYGEITNEGMIEFIKDFDLDLPELDDMINLNLDIDLNELDFNNKVDDNQDEIPEPKTEAKTKKGELWILGNHRVLCGDATNEADVKRLMNDKKADIVLTDPPYGIDLDTDWSKMTGKNIKVVRNVNTFSKIKGDNTSYNPSHIFKIFNNCKEIFLFGGDYFCKSLPEGGSWLIWDKRQTEQLDKMYGSCFEVCWSKNKHRKELIRITWAGFLGHNRTVDTDRKIHPTQKPVKLMEWFINKFSKINNLIIDVYLGSGSTLIACEKTNRCCYGMEIEPVYVDVILERWAKYTNQDPVREDGVKWSELK